MDLIIPAITMIYSNYEFQSHYSSFYLIKQAKFYGLEKT